MRLWLTQTCNSFSEASLSYIRQRNQLQLSIVQQIRGWHFKHTKRFQNINVVGLSMKFHILHDNGGGNKFKWISRMRKRFAFYKFSERSHLSVTFLRETLGVEKLSLRRFSLKKIKFSNFFCFQDMKEQFFSSLA